MNIYPAIDLKDGKCVRLEQGEMDRATEFNADPADQAGQFERTGFSWVHVVDLNGAFEGKPVNDGAVRSIRAGTDLKIQLGGGIRDRATAEAWLEAGVTRIILGTVAVRNPELVTELAKAHPGRVAVGIDARGGRVAVQGWAEETELDVKELAKKFEQSGVAAIIYTDILRDGLLKGINVEATLALAQSVRIPIIASGGLSSLDDVKALAKHVDDGIEGVIAGRALYDGRLNAAEAVAFLQELSAK